MLLAECWSPYICGWFFITIAVLVLGMRILSWNCWGAGSAPTVRALKALVHKESPDIIFISESKAKSPRVEKN